MMFARQRNHLVTHFSERIPVVKRRMTVLTKRFRCGDATRMACKTDTPVDENAWGSERKWNANFTITFTELSQDEIIPRYL